MIEKNKILNLFLDNISGDITPEDMRTFVNSVYDSQENLIRKITDISDFTFSDYMVNKNDLIVINEEGNPNNKNGLYLASKDNPLIEDLELISSDIEINDILNSGNNNDILSTLDGVLTWIPQKHGYYIKGSKLIQDILNIIPLNAGEIFIALDTQEYVEVPGKSGDGYSWDGDKWLNIGRLVGDVGPAGKDGKDGKDGASDATLVPTDVTNFNNNLSAADTDVQKAFDTIDNLSLGVIEVDTTIYVDLTGNDTTGDGSIGSPYASPHKALNYLSGFRFKDDVLITISVGTGEYNFSETIIVNHPQANQIHILGAALTGNKPQGVWYVPLDGAYDGGATDKFVCTNKAGEDDATDRATNIALVKDRYATVFVFGDCHGVSVENTILGNFDNLGIIGNSGSYNGISLGHTTWENEYIKPGGGIRLGLTKNDCNVAIIGWQNGIILENSQGSYLGGVQVGHCFRMGIRAKFSGIHTGDSEKTAAFNCGYTGLYLMTSSISYEFPHLYGNKTGFSLEGMNVYRVNTNIIGNDAAFSAAGSIISIFNTNDSNALVMDNNNLISSTIFEHSEVTCYINDGATFANNGTLDTSSMTGSEIVFNTDEAGTGMSFVQPYDKWTASNYIGNSTIAKNYGDAADAATDVTNFNNNLSAADTDVQKALETLDELSASAGGTGLEAIDEGNGIGWRLVGRDEGGYTNIGENAVDFSWGGFGDGYGAEGQSSLVQGFRSKATTGHSIALGPNATATGAAAVSLGGANAVGDRSVALGSNGDAIGDYSLVGGNDTRMEMNNGTAFGTYNNYSAGSIFDIGIGIFDEHKNAFEVYTDGRVHAPSLELASIIDNKCLVTKEYTDANSGVQSDTSSDAGSDQILNMVSLSQAEYDALTPVLTTLYVIV